MNYQRGLSRKAIAKRITGLLVMVAVLFGVGGFGIGWGIRSHITAKSGQNKSTLTTEQDVSESAAFAIYGSTDTRIFTNEISLDWGDDIFEDFQPLDVSMDESEQEFVYALCQGYNIDFCLVMALIQVESDFQDNVISTTGDYGLMQINQMNHEELTEILGVTDYLDPYQNIRAGVFVLRKLFEKYDDVDLVLMSYNMGESAALTLWENGVYSSRYSEKITEVQQQFYEELGLK